MRTLLVILLCAFVAFITHLTISLFELLFGSGWWLFVAFGLGVIIALAIIFSLSEYFETQRNLEFDRKEKLEREASLKAWREQQNKQ